MTLFDYTVVLYVRAVRFIRGETRGQRGLPVCPPQEPSERVGLLLLPGGSGVSAAQRPPGFGEIPCRLWFVRRTREVEGNSGRSHVYCLPLLLVVSLALLLPYLLEVLHDPPLKVVVSRGCLYLGVCAFDLCLAIG